MLWAAEMKQGIAGSELRGEFAQELLRHWEPLFLKQLSVCWRTAPGAGTETKHPLSLWHKGCFAPTPRREAPWTEILHPALGVMLCHHQFHPGSH